MTAPTVTSPGVARAVDRVLGPGVELRPAQVDALDGLDERDTLLVARSGVGKSAVYAIATILSGRLTVVVSPLLALQRDQADALRAAGLRADTLSSARSAAQHRRTLQAAVDHELDLVLLAPEQLARRDVVEKLALGDVGLVVVDEAHCVSEWGHDFRPDYLAVASAVRALGGPRVLALTATASPRVRLEVVERLGMRDARLVVHDADRPNIWLGVEHRADESARDDAVVRTVLDEPGPTLVYARTRSHAERLGQAVSDAGRPATTYHAGLPAAQRARLEREFLAGRGDVMVATSAFGMGVDRPDVRLVVHAGLPPSLDAYYQEVGRAGRDGQSARAVAVALPGDDGLNRYLSSSSLPRAATVRAVLEAVDRGAGSRDDVRAVTGLAARTVSRTLAALVDVAAVTSTSDGYAGTGTAPDTAMGALRARQERRAALDRSRADLVRTYADSSDCRRRVLLELLGEEHHGRCGRCDSCAAGTSLDVVDAPVRIGQRVEHEEWGPGTVGVVEAERVTVLFDERGYVTLDTEIALDAGLLRVAEDAPGRTVRVARATPGA